MCIPQWSSLPLLILLLLLQLPESMHASSPSSSSSSQSRNSSHAQVEALVAFKSAVGNPPVLRNWVGEKPCQDSWVGIKCNGKLKSSTVVFMKLVGYKLEGSISPALQNLTSLTALWLNDNYLRGYIPSELGNLKRLKSLRLSNNSLRGIVPASLTLLPNLKELTLTGNHLSGSFPFEGAISRVKIVQVDGNDDLCSQSGSYNLSACPFPSNATLTFPSPRILNDEDPGKSKPPVAAIVGGAVGAVVLVLLTIALVCYYLMRARNFSSRTSESGSSEPSVQRWAAGHESPLPAGGISLQEIQGARLFAFVELEHATKNFNESNLIGQGSFGFVYKGLLYDGTIVAIKRRTGNPSQDFANEVQYLSQIRHRHLVSLLGCCQENGQQLLVYDYLPNGSVSSHLYDASGSSLGKLDFKQRLSIASCAAKGLQHLHNLRPLLAHKDFKTSNVLVDEDLIARVSDFGLYRLLAGVHEAGASSPMNGFLDPEFNESRRLNEKSDVYSFGVFLLELASGREAINLNLRPPEQYLVKLAQSLNEQNMVDALTDNKLNQNFTAEGMRDFITLALQCVETASVRRPTMAHVTQELDRLTERERGLTASMVEGTTTVTLGSELFKRATELE